MDDKVKGIIVKLIDYKDADKLASIFTLEQGLITAKFIGVKKDKAKFKAIAQPFVFADFVLTSKGNAKTVTSADLIDNFFNILTDYNKTICGYILLDMIKSILPSEKKEEDIFLLTLSALKNIENDNEFVATIDYILKFISFSGMELQFPDVDYVYFNKETAEFSTNRDINSQQIDKKVYTLLKNINRGEKVDANPTTLKQALRLLHNVIFIKFGEDIKSFEFI